MWDNPNIKQRINGRLREVEEVPISHAVHTFAARKSKDTNPRIVEMVIDDKKIGIWYYRSNEFVDQPYYVSSLCLQPHVGPANLAMPMFYGEGTYEEDPAITRLLSQEKNLADFLECAKKAGAAF